MLGCPTTTPAPFCAESAYNGPQTTEKGDNMEKLLLTRKEAADVLNISVDTLDELTATQAAAWRLPTYKRP